MRTHPVLLRWGLYQAAVSGAFNAFWTTVSFVLTGPRFHYSPIGVGVFALVGAAGPAIAPFAGRWADRALVRPMTGATFAVAGFGGHSVVLIALAAALIDIAVQTTLIPQPAHRLPARPGRPHPAQQRLHRDVLHGRRGRIPTRLGRLPRRRLDRAPPARRRAAAPGPPLLGHGARGRKAPGRITP
ncbi:hypothetical protein [Streptomyces rhizosphaerihabitans]|uniref:hypothetical protein n=1 Tax=Streptomyces rhizosphaerihabitans TaxID=1266770 RepID=UPI0021BF5ECA|nr:hypothetical protein [Streptomyces rhizosphaerihabitans]MCT9010569.1 hypothetical protein [Streptomyces rhizosphaerihabitans]